MIVRVLPLLAVTSGLFYCYFFVQADSQFGNFLSVFLSPHCLDPGKDVCGNLLNLRNKTKLTVLIRLQQGGLV